ncbi:sugar nucleotide-binding protein [Janibacter sp. G1551]|uniref:sugar nucleotide-binding protein n=1 Tax=Janibacter sp. G1551 TaxID=3420440 RepID=UPI003D05E771
MTELSVERTAIPGLLVLRLPVHRDERGWFKENWQREKMIALGLPDFAPVQNNVSFNASRGATRGIHAEPWDKLVSVSTGQVFGAWVDLREGPTFGATVTQLVDESVAVFVPCGVGNSYQALADDTTYSYLVNAHWHPGVTYPAVHLGDERLGIEWPIPLAESEISAKDHANPRWDDVVPMPRRRPLVLGGTGQIGRALRELLPDAIAPTRAELDLSDPASVAAWDFAAHDVVINAAAYTAVDAAETDDGRASAWALNAVGPATLARLAREHQLRLVHYSSDYVFDGTREVHDEDEAPSPLGVYGQTKAAGDLAVATAPDHLILRTTWVIGEGANFVATMARLAGDGISPAVVDDQVGRLSFAQDVAAATVHLLESGAPTGTYDVTNDGDPLTWAALAREVFAARGRAREDVRAITSAEFAASRPGLTAPRPAHSTLDLTRLTATGFSPRDHVEALHDWLSRHD